MVKVHKESKNITEEKLVELKEILPQCFVEGKIDFELLKKILGDHVDQEDEKYTFSWKGKNDMFRNIKLTSNETKYLTESLMYNSKRVIDGQYALINEDTYYIRKNNKWEKDDNPELIELFVKDPSVLCNFKKKCVNMSQPRQPNDTCESIDDNSSIIKKKLIDDIINEFDVTYTQTVNEIEQKLSIDYEYIKNVLPRIIKNGMLNKLKYSNQQLAIGASINNELYGEDITTNKSPYLKLYYMILKQDDFVKRQFDIVKFVNRYTRQYIVNTD